MHQPGHHDIHAHVEGPQGLGQQPTRNHVHIVSGSEALWEARQWFHDVESALDQLDLLFEDLDPGAPGACLLFRRLGRTAHFVEGILSTANAKFSE